MLETDPCDWALGDDGDIDITDDIRFTSGNDAVAQGCDIVMHTFKGEVFTNIDEGFPWFQEVLGRPYNPGRFSALMRENLLTAPGVAEVTSMSSSFDKQTRELTAEATVITTWGAVVTVPIVEDI